jgi:glc operon protein GlcG
MKRSVLFVLALVATMTGSSVAALAQVVAQHNALTLEGAQVIIAAATAAANGFKTHGGIAVVDAGGNLIAAVLLDGSFPQASTVAIGKAHTAAVFRTDTANFEKAINGGRTTLVAMQNFTPLQGGVLITIGGEVVGAVGVSGTDSQQQDEAVAKAGAAALAGR